MTCKEAYEYMMRYFDGELNNCEFIHLEQHISECKNCMNDFRFLEEAFRILKVEEVDKLPLDFTCQVMSKIENMEEIKKRQTEKLLFVLSCVATVIFGMLGFLALILFKTSILSFLAVKAIESKIFSAVFMFAAKIYYLFDLITDIAKNYFVDALNLCGYIVAAFGLSYIIELFKQKRTIKR